MVWGWGALSSMIFLNRYFPPIIFYQKQEEKKREQYFSVKLNTVSWVCVDSSPLPQWPSSPHACEMWKMLLTQAKAQAPSAHIPDTTLTQHVWCCIFLSHWQSGSESYCIHLGKGMEQNESHSKQHYLPFLPCPQALPFHVWMQEAK